MNTATNFKPTHRIHFHEVSLNVNSFHDVMLLEPNRGGTAYAPTLSEFKAGVTKEAYWAKTPLTHNDGWVPSYESVMTFLRVETL